MVRSRYYSSVGIVDVNTALSSARIIVITLSLLVLFISYRWLIPRLPTTAKWIVLAIFSLHAFVVLMAMQAVTLDTYVLRLFHLDMENNLATSVAGMQLALVAELALLTAWFTRARPRWRRLYLVGFGLLYFYFSWDELTLQHEQLDNWEQVYAAIGIVVVAATSLLAARSARRTWTWYICLSTGLAMSAAGGIVIEQLRFNDICGGLGFVYYSAFLDRDKCLIYLIEESLELLGAWLLLVAMFGLLSDVVAKPKRSLRWLLYALPVATFVVCVAISDLDLERVHRKIEASPADVTFESGIQLYGYQIERETKEDRLQISLWLSAQPFGYDGLGYSIHLLDSITGESLTSRDQFVSVAGSRVRGPWHLPVFHQFLQLETPAEIPRDKALLVVLTTWREEGDHYTLQKVRSSDLSLLSDSQVVLAEVVIPAVSFGAPKAMLATYENTMMLGTVNLPDRAHSAETLAVSFNWRAENELTEDYIQFLHFVHEESGELRAFDQPPLGARLPTRLWYSGLADSETWLIPLPADLAPGRYQVWTGLYRQSDLQRLPAVDADGAPYPDARVPLGSLVIEPA